jgi:hypothetical protein
MKPVTVSIKAEFGSEFQRDVSMRVLRAALSQWKAGVKSAHRKNRVTVSGLALMDSAAEGVSAEAAEAIAPSRPVSSP